MSFNNKRSIGSDAKVSQQKRSNCGGAEEDELCEVMAALNRSIPLALTFFRRVCDLLAVHRSTKNANIVQRAGTMMVQLFEEAGIGIDALAAVCKADFSVGDQLDEAFDRRAFPEVVCSLLPPTDLQDFFRDAMSHLVYTGKWMLAAGKCALFSPVVASAITTPAPMHLLTKLPLHLQLVPTHPASVPTTR